LQLNLRNKKAAPAALTSVEDSEDFNFAISHQATDKNLLQFALVCKFSSVQNALS